MTTRQVLGLVIAAVIIIGGALVYQPPSVDRQAVYEACMASIPGSATSFDAIQTCTDKANAAR